MVLKLNFLKFLLFLNWTELYEKKAFFLFSLKSWLDLIKEIKKRIAIRKSFQTSKLNPHSNARNFHDSSNHRKFLKDSVLYLFIY